jgi:hypothetical protein
MTNYYNMAAAGHEGRAGDFVIALCEAIAPFDAVALDEGQKAGVLERVAGFVQGELDSIPLPARMAFTAGMWCFRGWVVLRYARGFLSLAPAKRRAAVAAWTWGRVALARLLFRVVRYTAFLAFYEDGEVQAALPEAAGRGAGAGDS